MIKDTLVNMKRDSLLLSENPSEKKLKSIMHKYKTIFTGKKLNKVLSVEVAHFLNIENDEFNSKIDKIAFELKMDLEELHKMKSLDPDTTDAYYISLF